MPYIALGRREALEPTSVDVAESPGELNYQITRLLVEYTENHGASYGVMNSLVGVLECAKLELYRRVIALYEEVKMNESGDVYGPR